LGARLTNLLGTDGEVEYLGLIKQEQENASKVAGMLETLVHEVPLLTDVPVADVLALRSQQRDAFVIYRDALSRIAEEHLAQGHPMSAQDAATLYAEVLAPKLSRLRLETEVFKKAQRKRAGVKIVAAGALVGLGVIGGIFPPQISELMKAIGGVSLLKDLFESIVGTTDQPSSVQSHELYFLLKLQAGH
jgi:hypothetical protein